MDAIPLRIMGCGDWLGNIFFLRIGITMSESSKQDEDRRPDADNSQEPRQDSASKETPEQKKRREHLGTASNLLDIIRAFFG
jgi:hypothetical protein